jgi:endonuclease YncB( thermonuclease family)
MRLLFILFCLLATSADAGIYFGRVVSISDGDTLTLLDKFKHQHKIRLAGIDAPERRQPYGARSKQHLADLVFGKEIEAECLKVDRYKREVCKILINGVDINLVQVRAGMAWWYRTYAKDQSRIDQSLYSAAEKEARDQRRGLWGETEAVAPWEWRREQK